MMGNYKLTRRQFITGVGTVFTLPLLESLVPFSSAFAQAAGDPRRWVVFYLPNGTYNRPDKPLWVPPSVNQALSAGNTTDVFSPFSANYADFSVISQIRYQARLANRNGDDHEGSAQTYITGVSSIGATTTSLDHILAERLGKPSYTLHGGNHTTGDLAGDAFFSYRNGRGVRGISNVGDLYRDLYGKIVPGTPTLTSANPVNRSIIDSSLADINALKASVGTQDKQKLDEYLTALRDLELKIANTSTGGNGGNSSTCVQPTLDPRLDTTNVGSSELYVPRMIAFNDMIKIAFACDITRTVTVMGDVETSPRTYQNAPPNLSLNGFNIGGGIASHIGISHNPDNPAEKVRRCTVRDRILFNIIVDLINKLKSSTDASGSRMLDNTIIQVGYGIEDGDHGGGSGVSGARYDYSKTTGCGPLVIAGGRNFMSPGRHIGLSGYDLADVYYTFASHLGSGLENFQGYNRRAPL